ncbi:hypothetical protein LTR50_003144 [Elasticomyces elasticus]|nr:hypothetical protein LTR50_003144 [Elasticomyces elasticus]
MAIAKKIKSWARHILSCCDEQEEEKPLQIGYPTDFRRVEDVRIDDLPMEQYETLPCLCPITPLKHSRLISIREKAAADAERMFSRLEPLSSNPPHPSSPPSRLDRVKQHTRKISNHLKQGYSPVTGCDSSSYSTDDQDVLLGARVASNDIGIRRCGTVMTTSRDSITLHGSETPEADKDSGKGMLRF